MYTYFLIDKHTFFMNWRYIFTYTVKSCYNEFEGDRKLLRYIDSFAMQIYLKIFDLKKVRKNFKQIVITVFLSKLKFFWSNTSL